MSVVYIYRLIFWLLCLSIVFPFGTVFAKPTIIQIYLDGITYSKKLPFDTRLFMSIYTNLDGHTDLKRVPYSPYNWDETMVPQIKNVLLWQGILRDQASLYFQAELANDGLNQFIMDQSKGAFSYRLENHMQEGIHATFGLWKGAMTEKLWKTPSVYNHNFQLHSNQGSYTLQMRVELRPIEPWIRE